MTEIKQGAFLYYPHKNNVIPKRCIIKEFDDSSVIFECQVGVYGASEEPFWWTSDESSKDIKLDRKEFEKEYLPFLYETRKDYVEEIKQKSKEAFDTRDKTLKMIVQLIQQARTGDTNLIIPYYYEEFIKRLKEELPDIGRLL